jgi:hypothetical protein
VLGFFLAFPGVTVLRDGKAEVAAQRAGLVLGADQAALAQDRHHLAGEPAELRRVPDVDVVAVQCAALEPALHLVRHRLR